LLDFLFEFFFWPIAGKKNKAKTKASNLRVCLSEIKCAKAQKRGVEPARPHYY
jgi:hypothetical protein